MNWLTGKLALTESAANRFAGVASDQRINKCVDGVKQVESVLMQDFSDHWPITGISTTAKARTQSVNAAQISLICHHPE